MFITEAATGKKHKVIVEPVVYEDYAKITKAKYFCDWKTERKYAVYKLRRGDSDTILGLMSLVVDEREKRIEINLLAVSVENRGKKKQYDRIAGTLIAYACRQAVKLFGINACISLVPKTKLKKYYKDAYGMLDAGFRICLLGLPLLKMLNKYENYESK